MSLCHNPCCILHAENAAGSKQPQLSRCRAQISWPEALSIESMADTRELAVHLCLCPNLLLVCEHHGKATSPPLTLGLPIEARQRRCVSLASESTTTKKTFNALNYIVVLASIYTGKFDYCRNMPNR